MSVCVVRNHPEASRLVFQSLSQNDGGQGTKIVSSNEKELQAFNSFGLNFHKDRVFDQNLAGKHAIGYYSPDLAEQNQPFVGCTRFGVFAFCLIGDLANASQIREKIGHVAFQVGGAPELFMRLATGSRDQTFFAALQSAMEHASGSYVFIAFDQAHVYVVDSCVDRRYLLLVGRTDEQATVVSSDYSCLSALNAKFKYCIPYGVSMLAKLEACDGQGRLF